VKFKDNKSTSASDNQKKEEKVSPFARESLVLSLCRGKFVSEVEKVEKFLVAVESSPD
jgi:hypothetical protein